MKSFKQFLNEDMPPNCAGGGAIAGIGVGPQGEPGRRKAIMAKVQKRKLPKNPNESSVART